MFLCTISELFVQRQRSCFSWVKSQKMTYTSVEMEKARGNIQNDEFLIFFYQGSLNLQIQWNNRKSQKLIFSVQLKCVKLINRWSFETLSKPGCFVACMSAKTGKGQDCDFKILQHINATRDRLFCLEKNDTNADLSFISSLYAVRLHCIDFYLLSHIH